MKGSYYFDHAATTPIHPEVIEEMLKVMQQGPSNASSMHQYGRRAKAYLNKARDTISRHLGCRPSELIFTSGGTESDNLAIIGAARSQKAKGRTGLVTSAIEHHAVLHTMQWLAKHEGFTLHIVSVDETGMLRMDELRAVLDDNIAVISIMHGNNEVGTIQPIEEIGLLAKQCGALLHVDAVQTLGHLDYRLNELPVHFMSFSAHKINGPQGVGALYIASETPLEALQQGGSQERKRRAGTENIASIVGFAKALDICVNKRNIWQPYVGQLRYRWIELLQRDLDKNAIIVNGHTTATLPHIVNISFIGVDTESMLMNLDMEGIAAASGSACTSGSLERSHVLKAMELSEERLNSAIRFSFGMGNDVAQLEEAAPLVTAIAKRLYR